jgi:acyl-coenzyme A synthetase/AMP-(fatty) acid ligase
MAGCRRGAPACGDSYWFMVAIFALLHAGAVPVMPPNTQPGTLAALASEFDLLVTDQAAGAASSFMLEAGREDPGALDPFDSDRTLMEFFTSGTMGSPKRVTKPVRLLEREIDVLDGLWGKAMAGGLVLSTVSHQHIYGLTFKLLWPLSRGTPFSGETHDLWETVLQDLPPGGTLVTSPAHLTRLAGIGPLPAGRGPALVLSAGAALPPAAARQASNILGTATTEIFGSTETGAFATRRAEGKDEPWSPLTGIRLGLTPDGRLKLRGAFVDTEGWYETSDLADLPGDGGFRFRGRSDRVVKIEGKRVSLNELELQLCDTAWVKAAATAVISDNAGRLGAAVVLTPEGRAKLAVLGRFRLGRFLRRELAGLQDPAGLPRLWRFVEDLPAAHMGKRSETDIAALFSDGELR